MQRIIVDLPDPEGPQMTMRSPPMTRRLMSRSTWKSPYHLFILTMSTATALASRAGLPTAESSSVLMRPASSFVALAQARLGRASVARHAVAEDQIEHRGDGVARRRGHRRRPFRIDARHLDRVQQIEDADDGDERRVLEQADIGV